MKTETFQEAFYLDQKIAITKDKINTISKLLTYNVECNITYSSCHRVTDYKSNNNEAIKELLIKDKELLEKQLKELEYQFENL